MNFKSFPTKYKELEFYKKPPLVFNQKSQEIKSGVMMLDFDAPYPQNPNKSPILHWMNILDNEVDYLPPDPPKDSKPHRYIVYKVAFQSEKGKEEFEKDRDVFSSLSRYNFPFDDFLQSYNLKIVGEGKFECCQ